MKHKEIAPEYVTLSSAARYCSLSKHALHQKIKRGELAYYPAKRFVRISIVDLDAMMYSLRVSQRSAHKRVLERSSWATRVIAVATVALAFAAWAPLIITVLK